MPQRWENGDPAPAITFGASNRASKGIGTTLTNVFSHPVPYVGPWIVDCRLLIAHSGSPTGFTVTPGFTGTASLVGLTIERDTGSARATAVITTFGNASGSSVFIICQIKGLFIATAKGTVTIGCTRTGGTNSNILAGSYLNLTEGD